MEYNQVDPGAVEEYVMSQRSGSIHTVRDYILNLSTVYNQMYCTRMPEDEAWKKAESILNSLADEGRIRANWREYPDTRQYGWVNLG